MLRSFIQRPYLHDVVLVGLALDCRGDDQEAKLGNLGRVTFLGNSSKIHGIEVVWILV